MSTAVTILGLAVGVLGTLAAWIALKMAKWPERDARRGATTDEFMATRYHQKECIRELIDTALRMQRDFAAVPDLPMLTRPGWILDEPVPLDTVALQRVELPGERPHQAALDLLRPYWPLRGNGERMKTYHEAIEAYDRPTSWFNGASYRLLQVTPKPGTLEMTFTDAWYWDMIDTTESLLYEAAFVHDRSGRSSISGRYRQYLDNPFDFSRRCAIPGVDAITIRKDDGRATFYVHRREAVKVASAQNVTGIVPAGEFQPSDDSWAARAIDFDLWRSILREYVEEFLDLEEARLRIGAPIDYLNELPYASLHSAYLAGAIQPRLLGIGLDPVTWKPTILTVCVFPADLFDDLFAEMVRDNQEGLLESPVRNRTVGRPVEGWPFTREMVSAYTDDLGVLPAARAGLALAWRHRESLFLPD